MKINGEIFKGKNEQLNCKGTWASHLLPPEHRFINLHPSLTITFVSRCISLWDGWFLHMSCKWPLCAKQIQCCQPSLLLLWENSCLGAKMGLGAKTYSGACLCLPFSAITNTIPLTGSPAAGISGAITMLVAPQGPSGAPTSYPNPPASSGWGGRRFGRGWCGKARLKVTDLPERVKWAVDVFEAANWV